jgi:mannosidase alpha-like ER degradation enhancer 1
VGHYDVRAGHIVYVNDSSIFTPPADPFDDVEVQRALDLPLRFFTEATKSLFEAQTGIPDLLNMMDVLTSGYTALFGPELGVPPGGDQPLLRINNQNGVPVSRDDRNTYGCLPYEKTLQDAVILVHRGECTFLEKLLMARDAGSVGVLVVSDEDVAMNPTADPKELEAAGDLGDVGLVVLPLQVGQLVHEMLDSTEERGGQVMLQVDPERMSAPSPDVLHETEKEKVHKILYLNGHPLLNTRLLI